MTDFESVQIYTALRELEKGPLATLVSISVRHLPERSKGHTISPILRLNLLKGQHSI